MTAVPEKLWAPVVKSQPNRGQDHIVYLCCRRTKKDAEACFLRRIQVKERPFAAKNVRFPRVIVSEIVKPKGEVK